MAGRHHPSLQTLLVVSSFTEPEIRVLQRYFYCIRPYHMETGTEFLETLFQGCHNLTVLAAGLGVVMKTTPSRRTYRETISAKQLPIEKALAFAKGGHLELLQALLSSESGRAVSLDDVLSYAIHGNSLEVVAWLLKIYPLSVDKYQFNNAVLTGNLELVALLLTRASAKEFSTPVETACRNNNLAMAQLLLSHGGIASTMALGRAAEHGNLELVKFIYSHCGKVDLGALNQALEGCNIQVVQFLYERLHFPSAEVHAKELGHVLWVAVAVPQQPLAMIKYLLSLGPCKIDQGFLRSAQAGRLDIVQFFMDRASHLLDQALIAAATKGHLEVVTFLIDKVSTSCLRKATNEAACSDSWQTLALLLEKGASTPLKALRYSLKRSECTSGLKLLTLVKLEQLTSLELTSLAELVAMSGSGPLMDSVLAQTRPRLELSELVRQAVKHRNRPALESLIAHEAPVTESDLYRVESHYVSSSEEDEEDEE